MSKRILFLESTDDGTVGGSQRVLLEVIQHLDRTRFEPIVICYRDHFLVPEFRKLGPVSVISMSSLRISERFPGLARLAMKIRPAWWALLAVQKVYNFCAHFIPWVVRVMALLVRERIDLVCLNNAPVLLDWLLACKLTRRPIVSYFRGTPVLTRFQRTMLPYHDAVFSISEAVTENVRAQGAKVENFVLVYDGIDASAVQRRVTKPRERTRQEFLDDCKRPLIGVVNNLKHWKGQHVAIEAMTLLRERRPDVMCLLIGDVADIDRAYAEDLKRTVAERGLEHNVIFTGQRGDVPDLLAALDLVMHTSLSGEGFPRVILETMILGRPMIASSSGPNVEMIEDGVSGFLVPPGDANALAARIEEALARPDATRAAGERARERAERLFNIDINMRKTEDVFATLLADPA